MKRDAKADLEMCEKATPGPWKQMAYFVRLDELYDKVRYPKDIYTPFAREEDAKFTSVAREALPYWIKRAQEAEKLLKEILPAAKYLSQRYDNGTDKELNFWTAMVAKITKFLGVEPCDK
jgi:hypothetical protein